MFDLPPPGCTCRRLADRLRVELTGAEVPPCPAHEPDAHQQQQADQAATDTRATADQAADAYGVTVTDDPPPADPMAGALARKVGASSSLPLNAPPSAYPALAGWTDGPDAA
jgi:hypothetical protein